MKLIVHAGFNNLLRINDIGLIQISGVIKFNEKIKPIALPTEDRNFDGYPLVATGWGKLWVSTSDFLKIVDPLLFFHFSKLLLYLT